MSADKYTSLYHLTSAGWVSGAEGCYLSKEEEKSNPAPSNCLLTLRYEEFTPYAKTVYSCGVDYIVDATNAKALLRAISIYGIAPPEKLDENEKYGFTLLGVK